MTLSYEALPKRKLSVNRGIGKKFTDPEGNEWEFVQGHKYGIVRLRITTFRGISFGAVHFYGSLRVEGCDMKCVKSVDGRHQVGHTYGIGGSIDELKPKDTVGIYLELERPITEAELATERFETYRHFKNPKTQGFNNTTLLREEAHRIFKKHFTKDWKLEEDRY